MFLKGSSIKNVILCLVIMLFLSAATVPAQAATLVRTVSITAQNTYSGEILPMGKGRNGYMNISVSGTWEATVTLQRSFDDGATWLDVVEYTENAEQALIDQEAGVRYRIGVATGAFTSGTIVCRLSVGN